MISITNPAGVAAAGAFANVTSNGALGNGTADDRAAIQATIDAVSAVGGGIVYLPAGDFLIKRPLWLPAKVTLMGAGRGATKITKPATIKSLLTANANAGTNTVTVASATGFAVGEPVFIYDTANFEWASTKGVITGINGNVITYTNSEGVTGATGNYQTNRAATATTSFPLIRNELASTNLSIRDLTLDHNQNANDPSGATASFTIAPVHLVEAYYSLLDNVEILNAAGDAYSDQANDGTNIPTPAAANIKTTKNTIRSCRIRNATRHGVHLGTCLSGGIIEGNEITDCPGFGVYYCAFMTNTIASKNLVENCGSGFAGIDDRDSGNIITANTVKNWTAFAVEASAVATGASGAGLGKNIVSNNIFIDTSTSSGGIYWNLPDGLIFGNYITTAGGNESIKLAANADRTILSTNTINGGGTGSTGIYLEGCDDVRLIANVIKSVYYGTSIRGVSRMVAIGNHFSSIATSQAWVFTTSTSTDCVIKDEQNNTAANPVTESVAATRLVYEGMGTNGTADPASSGQWNGITGRRFDGQMVRWNSGGGEKISIFYNGVGWTTLN